MTMLIALKILRDAWRRHVAARSASLHELDARTLADIGIDASEIASVDAEARGATARTRLRIAAVAG
jgi:hypothetical protein